MPTSGNATSPTGVSNKLNTYVPPKGWDEITDSEKIERMREIIKSLSQQVGRLQSDFHVLRDSFKKHSHTDKEVVLPYDEYSHNSIFGSAEVSALQNYF